MTDMGKTMAEREKEPWFLESDGSTGSVLRNTRLRESNRSLVRKMMESAQRAMAETLKRAYKVDVTNKKMFPFWDEESQTANVNFRQTKFREAVYNLCYQLREANAEGALQQFLRAQINTITNGYYNLVETVHESIYQVVPSKMFIELYAPMYRGDVPRQVVRGQTYPEGRIVGEDIQLRNRKFGIIYPFERELWEDDQSGMVAQRSADGGEQMRILKDAWAFQKFIGTAGAYGDDPIPACETVPSDETAGWPWLPSSTPFVGGGFNRPASYGAMTPALIQAGDLQLMQQLDKLGNKMLVNPNTLLVGTSNKFSARTLLNSEWYPTTTSVKVGGGTGADTTIGGTFARNVMEGLYNLVVARFLPVKAWSIGEAGKGWVFQQRTPLEVTQENPQSGPAFSADEFRFKVRERWNCDAIEPRFWWLGNDGTI
jgi:hypothetical protein